MSQIKSTTQIQSTNSPVEDDVPVVGAGDTLSWENRYNMSDGIVTVSGLVLSDVVWDDLRVEPVARNTGTKTPVFELWKNGIYLYTFDDAIVALEKELFFTVQLPHSWAEGTEIRPHVHWVNKDAGGAGEEVRWGLEYTRANIGDVFPATTTVYGTEIAGGGDITAADSQMMTVFSGLDMTGYEISCIIACRLFRNSSNAADTYDGGDSALLYIDWHYQIDTLGSSEVYTK